MAQTSGGALAYIGGDNSNDIEIGSKTSKTTVVHLYNPTDGQFMDLAARYAAFGASGNAEAPTVSVNPSFGGSPMGMYADGGHLRFGVAGSERFRIQNDSGCVGGYFYSNGNYYAAGSIGVIGVEAGGSGSVFEQQAQDNSDPNIRSNGNAAYMTFHRPGRYAVRFGLDTDNKLKVGGWSMSGAYEIWHDGNVSTKTLPILNFTSTTETFTQVYADETTGEVDIDCNRGTFFLLHLVRGSNFTRFNSVPASPKVYSFTLQIRGNGVTFSINWGAIKWPNNVAPTVTPSLDKCDTFTIFTRDGGANWYGFQAGRNS
jgi:hypothetical protein